MADRGNVTPLIDPVDCDVRNVISRFHAPFKGNTITNFGDGIDCDVRNVISKFHSPVKGKVSAILSEPETSSTKQPVQMNWSL